MELCVTPLSENTVAVPDLLGIVGAEHTVRNR